MTRRDLMKAMFRGAVLVLAGGTGSLVWRNPARAASPPVLLHRFPDVLSVDGVDFLKKEWDTCIIYFNHVACHRQSCSYSLSALTMTRVPHGLYVVAAYLPPVARCFPDPTLITGRVEQARTQLRIMMQRDH